MKNLFLLFLVESSEILLVFLDFTRLTWFSVVFFPTFLLSQKGCVFKKSNFYLAKRVDGIEMRILSPWKALLADTAPWFYDLGNCALWVLIQNYSMVSVAVGSYINYVTHCGGERVKTKRYTELYGGLGQRCVTVTCY